MNFEKFRDKTIALLSQGSLTAKELVEKTGASRASVYRWLPLLEDVRKDESVYFLDKAPQPSPVEVVEESPQSQDNPINASAIASFAYKRMGDVRVTTVDGEPWFCLSDVCDVLLIANHRMVASRLDPDEKGYLPLTDSLGRNRQTTTFVNESGLYSVIIRSDKPEAKAFRKWITSDVLPSIRKTGKYLQDPLEKLGELLQEFAGNTPIQNGSVYIISAGEKFYKIGFTQCDVDSRMANLQTGCPLPLSVVTHQTKDNPRRVERVLHDALSDFRLSGEWFSLDEKHLAIACEVLEVA